MNKRAILIAIEGTDRSGKATQASILNTKLINNGYKSKVISFPDYDSETSYFIKKYLAGCYGDIKKMNAYESSILFAQDRLLKFHEEYKTNSPSFEDYDFIIFDRYIGSNLIHQGAKLDPGSDKFYYYIDYWYDFEVNKLGLPLPDLTIFLDMPIKYGKKISKNRLNKSNGSTEQDIHESNDDYMNNAYNSALKCAEYFNWEHINCISNIGPFNKIKSIKYISNEIYSKIKYFIDFFSVYNDLEEKNKIDTCPLQAEAYKDIPTDNCINSDDVKNNYYASLKCNESNDNENLHLYKINYNNIDSIVTNFLNNLNKGN